MAGMGGCGRRRRLGAGWAGTGVHGRIHRVYQDRHDHLSHDNHAVGSRDERAGVAEGGFHEWRNAMSPQSRLVAGIVLSYEVGSAERTSENSPSRTLVNNA